jgi:hypothetical protein
MLGFKRDKTLKSLVPLKDANKKPDVKKSIFKKFSNSVKKNVRGLSQLFNSTRKERSFEHRDAYPNKLEIIGKKIYMTPRPDEYIPSDYRHLNLSDNIHPETETETEPSKNNVYSVMNPGKKYILNPKKKNTSMYPEAYKGHKFVAETALSLSRTPRQKHLAHESNKGGRRRKTRRGSSKI